MTTDRFQIKLWGVRGSLPVWGPSFRKFGGNTICVEVRCGDHVMLFDAGSGLAPAGRALQNEGVEDITLFFTHCHYDHISGLPFFLPFYCNSSHLKIWTGHLGGAMSTQDMITDFMRKPFFPIGMEYCGKTLSTAEFTPGQRLLPYPGVVVTSMMLNHPGNSVGYRVDWQGRSFALITDTEHEPGILDPALVAFINGCDLMLYDATFTDEEFAAYKGFGHSTWQQAVRLAQRADVKQLGFIHHSKARTDAELTRIEGKAKALFPNAFCGRDLQMIDI